MGRKRWANLPTDARKHSAHIESILKLCKSKPVKILRGKHAQKRDLEFRDNNYLATVDLDNPVSKLSAIIQSRGDVAQKACDSCALGNGPFTLCVHIPSEQNGRCGCCIYLKTPCTNGDALQGCRVSTRPTSATASEASSCKSEGASRSNIVPDSSMKQVEMLYSTSDHPIQETGLDMPAYSQRSQIGSTSQYNILGLVLPRPLAELKELAETLEDALKDLDGRNMEELRDPPISDQYKSSTAFQTEEVNLWRTVQRQDKSAADLVVPSGSLQSPLAHHLNQPSLTTQNLHAEHSQTADDSNGCIAMVMGNAYEPNTLLFDHVHRREARSEAIREHHPKLLACHEEFTNHISESMMAKVEIIYGLKVQQRLLETHSFELLPLWGDFDGITVLLSYESNYANRDVRFRFRRAMLMVTHPQRMFFERRQIFRSIRQDKTMLAASLMVRGSVPWIKDYFSERKWFAHVPSLLQIKERSALEEISEHNLEMSAATILSVDEPVELASCQNRGAWDSFFNEMPHSNDAFRELIPLALEALDASDPYRWETPDSMPPRLLEWFRG